MNSQPKQGCVSMPLYPDTARGCPAWSPWNIHGESVACAHQTGSEGFLLQAVHHSAYILHGKVVNRETAPFHKIKELDIE